MPVRMRMRWTAYAGASTALAAGVILKALAQRPNFYSAAVYLSQSSANLMILTNLLFVIACTFLLGLQKLLYGNLRPIEIEQLYEKAWFAVTETCLAMTVFRGEIGLTFLAMFFSLLTGKVWGWIGEGRVEVLEQQPPRNPRLFHTRLALSLGLSVAFDLTMLEYVVKQVMRMARPDMMVMFGFEFAVLSITSISTAMRYAIDLIEIGIVREQKKHRIEEIKRERMQAAVTEFQETQGVQAASTPASGTLDATAASPTPTQRTLDQVSQEAFNQPVDENEVEVEGWEEKGRYMFYLNLATDFFKLVIYLAFFFILLVFYGLPIHILRDVFLTMRSFLKRISDFMKYRTATRDMNARYPDATAEDIGREDVCIICREEMRPYEPGVAQPGQPQPRPNPVAERMRPKKLPCGHVLHFSCLRSWLERQQICPTCRANVVRTGGPRGTNEAGGQAEAGQVNGGQHPPGPRPGPRIYQFGPLRIGVGAARGNNMFEELQQQLGDGAGPAPEGQVGNPDPHAPRQVGVGLGWSGRRRRRADQNLTTPQQLDALAARIRQDADELARSSTELSVLRSMQAELERLRSLRPGERQAQTDTTGQNAPQTARPALPPVPDVSTLVADQQQNILQAGSDRLPPGLTLPEGWTMMPLRPLQPDHQHHGQNLDPLGDMAPLFPPAFGAPPFPGPLAHPHYLAQPQRWPPTGTPSSGQTGIPQTVGLPFTVPVAPDREPGAISAAEHIANMEARQARQAARRGTLQTPEDIQARARRALMNMRVRAARPHPPTNSNPTVTGLNSAMPRAPFNTFGQSPAAVANANQEVPQADHPAAQLPTAHSLPSWGSSTPETTTHAQNEDDSSAGLSEPRVNGSHDQAVEDGAADGPSPNASQPKDRHATVEDAEEDLDLD
ncbi:RING finger protein [Fonsecaea pedrosoi]|nr:RING finger protein [Fonsecaea pedrosoi]